MSRKAHRQLPFEWQHPGMLKLEEAMDGWLLVIRHEASPREEDKRTLDMEPR